MLNRNLDLQRFKVLFLLRRLPGILSRMHRRFMELEIRRWFTTVRLMTILEEAHYSQIIVEHDPLLIVDSHEIVACISKAPKQASQEATILFCSPGINPFLEDLAMPGRYMFKRILSPYQ
ncbi:MAG: hypothetical protein MUO26_14625 [Methanotrichaceae archaeon]|nr:hypothetical protein [Methanotrichaceae archaeon]